LSLLAATCSLGRSLYIMMHSLLSRALAYAPLLLALSLPQHAHAKRIIQSTSLNPCMENSKFTASLFNVTFTPEDSILHINIDGVSSLEGNVTATISVIAYGYDVLERELDPCTMGDGFRGMCPMSQGPIQLDTNLKVEPEVSGQIPGMSLLSRPLDVQFFLIFYPPPQLSPIRCPISMERPKSWST
jgi:ML-like domain